MSLLKSLPNMKTSVKVPYVPKSISSFGKIYSYNLGNYSFL